MSVPPNNTEQLVAWTRVQRRASTLNRKANANIFETIEKNISETENRCLQVTSPKWDLESIEKAAAILEDLKDLKEAFEANELYNIFKASKEMFEEVKRI